MLGSPTTNEQPYTWSACGPVSHAANRQLEVGQD
jgi:hypothetical protein